MWRRLNIKDDKAVQESVRGTDSFFLPTGHAISSMMLVIRAKNESDHNAPNAIKPETLISAISEIKIEASSRVFKQYNAAVALAWATYKAGREPYVNLTQIAGGAHPAGWQEIAIPIDFGRFAHDRVCGLPAPLYKGGGLQMSITYNFPEDDGNGDNAFLAGAANHRYDLFADVMPHLNARSLQGMRVLEQTRRRTYTTRASGVEPISMSTDPRKQVVQYLVHAYKAGTREDKLLTSLDVVLNGNHTVMAGLWRDWQRKNADDSDLEYIRRVAMKANTISDEYWSGIPNVSPFYQAGSTGSEDVMLAPTVGDKITVATQTANDLGTLFLNSDVIPCTAIIDFNRDLKMQELLSMGQDKIHIKIENGEAGGATEFHECVLAPAEI